MDDRLKAIIDTAAIDGAKEVYAKYDEYLQACSDADAEYKQKLAQLQDDYAEAIKMFIVAESVKDAIINKLDKKD